MQSVQLISLAILVQLLVLPVLAAVNGHDNVNQRVQRAASPNLPEIMAEGQAVGTGMEKRRRRGTKLKALAGGAVAGLGGAMLYNAFKVENIQQ
uniref:Transmembrane protein n=1 Tax=Globodera rostochiensis TaxID=31243 RepID=A0A914H8Z7_GLORO